MKYCKSNLNFNFERNYCLFWLISIILKSLSDRHPTGIYRKVVSPPYSVKTTGQGTVIETSEYIFLFKHTYLIISLNQLLGWPLERALTDKFALRLCVKCKKKNISPAWCTLHPSTRRTVQHHGMGGPQHGPADSSSRGQHNGLARESSSGPRGVQIRSDPAYIPTVHAHTASKDSGYEISWS